MRVYILCREESSNTENLVKIMSILGVRVQVVEDKGEIPPGYEFTCSPWIGRVTAWDRVFYNIKEETSWFVEDDVAGSVASFAKLFEETNKVDVDLISMAIATKEEEPLWNHWERDPGFKTLRKSFNPLCRLSRGLIQRILSHRRRRGQFDFHEIMLPSLARTFLKLETVDSVGEIRWRPEHHLVRDGKICHPVKDSKLHKIICHHD